MYSQSEGRRHSFNNNKVLVGGDNGKTHGDKNHSNLIQINSDKKEPQSAPILSQMVNPFDVMPPNRRMTFQDVIELDDEASNEAYDEDLRTRGFDRDMDDRTDDFEDYEYQSRPRPMVNQRFPRNWSPRNFRPPGPNFGNQFWPRNGPRPVNRWTGPRPQRFW